jgi:methyltransferase (TIGR00027 family)
MMTEEGRNAELRNGGLPATALAVASGRAVETSRPDALIKDPFASALVVAARSPLDLPTVWPDNPSVAPPFQQPLLLASIYIGMRTRFIDDFVLSDPGPQTVILGAGLDTRAYRLAWPEGAKVMEVDSAEVLEFKDNVFGRLSVGPGCELVSLAADLSQAWREPLIAKGFDPQQPTTWILEGVLPYLDSSAQNSVLRGLVELSSPGSRAVIERAVPLAQTDELDAKLEEFSQLTGLSMSELLARADPPDALEVLQSAGWRCAATSVEGLCAKYGRALSLDAGASQDIQAAQAPEKGRGGFVTAWSPKD